MLEPKNHVPATSPQGLPPLRPPTKFGENHPAARGLAFLMMLLALVVQAVAGPACEVCDTPLEGGFFLFRDRAHATERAICEACTKLEVFCHGCGIPVKTAAKSYPDGRVLCRHDLPLAVETDEEMRSLFEEVKRDMLRLFRGYDPLPYHNITLVMVDSLPPSKAALTNATAHTLWLTLGQTRSVRRGQEISHNVVLLRGLTRNRMAAVAAHEYAHAWFNEHRSPDRKLDPNTLEAFCELVAHKLCTDRGLPFELEVIERNLYTRGQITTLLQIENDLRFHRLLDWMKSGVDDRLEQDSPETAVRLKSKAEPVRVYYPPPPSRYTDTLVLKAITRGKGGTFASVNGLVLGERESGRVRLGTNLVTITCARIEHDRIFIRQGTSTNLVELRLQTSPTAPGKATP